MRIMTASYRIKAAALLATAALMVFALAAAAYAGQAQFVNGVKHWSTGQHDLVSHTVWQHDASLEVVEGTVAKVTGYALHMDGEIFILAGAKMVDEKGVPVDVREIIGGEKIQLFYKNGILSNVTVTGVHPDWTRIRRDEQKHINEAERFKNMNSKEIQKAIDAENRARFEQQDRDRKHREQQIEEYNRRVQQGQER